MLSLFLQVQTIQKKLFEALLFDIVEQYNSQFTTHPEMNHGVGANSNSTPLFQDTSLTGGDVSVSSNFLLLCSFGPRFLHRILP